MSIATKFRRLTRVSLTFTVLILALSLVAGGCSKRDKVGEGDGGDGGGGGGGGGAVVGDADLPPNTGTAFCSADVLTGVAASGFLTLSIEAGDMIPLCSGWVFIADKTNERVILRNIITGAIDSTYDLPGAPDDMELDLDEKFLYVTLPEQHLIASINLINLETHIAPVNSEPGTIALTATEVLVTAAGGGELRVYSKPLLDHITNSEDITGEFIRFLTGTNRLIVANNSDVVLWSYALAGSVLTLVEINDDPTGSSTIGLEVSPDAVSVALVTDEGNGSFAGAYTINDYDSLTVDNPNGTWKVDQPITGAAFGPNDVYVLASGEDTLLVFDRDRRAEVTRISPSSDCDGTFDKVAFSRGADLAIGKMTCDPVASVEVHWWAPTAGFGNSDSAIGPNVAGLATIFPTGAGDPPLCTTDDVDALTSASSGSVTVPRSGDIVPVCDGWAFISERLTNRVSLINVITGVTMSQWDLRDMPRELFLDADDLDHRYLLASMPNGGGVARITLAGPNLGDLGYSNVRGLPTGLTHSGVNDILAPGRFEAPDEFQITGFNVDTLAAFGPFTLEVDFSSSTSRIAWDLATNQLFVSDSEGVARFEFTGGTPQFTLTNFDEDVLDDLNSEIVLASPNGTTIALVDQTAGLVYDIDDGETANLHLEWWEVDSDEAITDIAFDSFGNTFAVATTDELFVFDTGIDHDLMNEFNPSGCGADLGASPAISRGGDVGFYLTDCGDDGLTSNIYWYEL